LARRRRLAMLEPYALDLHAWMCVSKRQEAAPVASVSRPARSPMLRGQAGSTRKLFLDRPQRLDASPLLLAGPIPSPSGASAASGGCLAGASAASLSSPSHLASGASCPGSSSSRSLFAANIRVRSQSCVAQLPCGQRRRRRNSPVARFSPTLSPLYIKRFGSLSPSASRSCCRPPRSTVRPLRPFSIG
jgi:hypothetical protein